MKKLLTLFALPAALAMTSCSGTSTGADNGTTHSGGAAGDKPNVVVAFYGLEYATNQVAGDLVNLSSLTAPGAEAHGAELRPSQLAEISEADLVVYLDHFQPAIDAAVESSGNSRVLDVSKVIELLPNEGEAHEEHGTDEHEEGEHAEDGHDHDHGAFDPHFWQDPALMSKVGQAIAKELGQDFPQLKDQIEANAQSFAEDMTKLDEEFKTGLATCERKEFITSHEAFNYLAKKYGLSEIGISGISPEAEPSTARIAEVQQLAKQHNVTTIFFETLTSPAVSEAIAGDLGIKTAVLDPLEGITDKSPGTDYPSIMRANLAALKEANGCK